MSDPGLRWPGGRHRAQDQKSIDEKEASAKLSVAACPAESRAGDAWLQSPTVHLANGMAPKKEGTQRFLVTVIGHDHWKPEVRQWIEYPATTTATQVLAEFRKKYPPPFQVVIVSERPKTSAMG